MSIRCNWVNTKDQSGSYPLLNYYCLASVIAILSEKKSLLWMIRQLNHDKYSRCLKDTW